MYNSAKLSLSDTELNTTGWLVHHYPIHQIILRLIANQHILQLECIFPETDAVVIILQFIYKT